MLQPWEPLRSSLNLVGMNCLKDFVLVCPLPGIHCPSYSPCASFSVFRFVFQCHLPRESFLKEPLRSKASVSFTLWRLYLASLLCFFIALISAESNTHSQVSFTHTQCFFLPRVVHSSDFNDSQCRCLHSWPLQASSLLSLWQPIWMLTSASTHRKPAILHVLLCHLPLGAQTDHLIFPWVSPSPSSPFHPPFFHFPLV